MNHPPISDHAAPLAALAHPARLAIVERLAARPACCCKDVVSALDLAQSTVSQHLKVLVDAGLVTYAPERQRSRYTLDVEALESAAGALAALVERCREQRRDDAATMDDARAGCAAGGR